MILRAGTVPEVEPRGGYPAPYDLGRGRLRYRHLTDAGGLTKFGVAFETLLPGGQSSQPHWHEKEDEFLYMLDGTRTVVEDGDEAEIGPGDACCWKAGDTVAHTLINRSERAALYLIAGTKRDDEVCHYPGLDLRDTPEGYVHLDGTPYDSKERLDD